ncbi:MAG: LysM peptidoglycan-binding domain-containing protein [Planctomycetia bacterium]|nr:LysM peptidoglycan-binding domain-containing protein [Planctomycetia bacterium]
MNAEKKLGLTFVGILGVSFCGVLTMRLLEANKAEQIDINVGPPTTSAPPFATRTDDAAIIAEAKLPVAPAPSTPAAPSFATASKTGPETATPPKSGSYLPPLPKAGAPSAGVADARYGNGAPGGNPGYGTGSRYGTPGAPASSPTQPPPAVAGMNSATVNPAAMNPATTTAATGAPSPYGMGANPSRYGTPSTTPAAPPSFANSTPTASATLSPPVAPASSPYTAKPGYAPPAAAYAGSAASSAPVGGATDNPLRAGRPEEAAPATPTMPTTDSRYAAPNIASAPATSQVANPVTNPTANAIVPTSAAATNVLREPRPFDASATASQPLAATANSGYGRAPGVAALGALPPAGSQFANTNALRASASEPSTGNGTIAPTAATLPVAAAAPSASAVLSANPLPSAGAVSSTGTVSSASALPAVKNTPYVVTPDDNFWNISRKVYGDGSYYRALFAYNSDRYPHAEDVRAGSVLDVPPAEVLKQRYPELVSGAVAADGRPTDNALAGGRAAAAPAATYTVREGDTLFDIARRQLGKAGRWTELYELNRQTLGDNLENLRPGTQLVLPQ